MAYICYFSWIGQSLHTVCIFPELEMDLFMEDTGDLADTHRWLHTEKEREDNTLLIQM